MSLGLTPKLSMTEHKIFEMTIQKKKCAKIRFRFVFVEFLI